ncbi:MAG: isocitrate lyase/PEP mutase family protein [Pseudoflavonifractor sp.]|nr:isocitrate lyase/PEP mutase family protein [Pseudoflavonifractor sp.]
MLKNSAKILRELINQPEIIIAPGVYDGISTRCVNQAGFKAAYMTGAGVAASMTGFADIGLTTMTEMVSAARMIAMTSDIPLICDADTGYGNQLNVIRTVHEYEQAGVAAIQLEDQLAPKKCGHMGGKSLISADEFVQKLKAAVNEKFYRDTLIIARTDARAVEGFNHAVERAKMYIDAGVDMLFFEAPQSVEEVYQVGKLFGDQVHLLSNQVYGGKTPSMTADELQKAGYDLVIFPSTLPYAASVFLKQVSDNLMKIRTDKEAFPGSSNAMDLFLTMGLMEWREKEMKYGLK